MSLQIQHGLDDSFAEQDVTPSFISSQVSMSTNFILAPSNKSNNHNIINLTIQMPATEATPSARQSQRPECGAISSDQQQFIYLYEVWVGMLYLQNDLLPMRDHLAIN